MLNGVPIRIEKAQPKRRNDNEGKFRKEFRDRPYDKVMALERFFLFLHLFFIIDFFFFS
jgi:hypothetical protein